MSALGFAPGLLANSGGAPAFSTGAPGDDTCMACHSGPLNDPRGRVTISLPSASYTPGQTMRVTVTITDPQARRWGFQLAARLSSDPANRGAGTLAAPAGGQVRILNVGSFQWATHTLAGTRSGTAGPVSFEVDWAPPAAGAGEVTFYAAANAANNSNSPEGDFIYTTSLKVPEQAAAPVPTMRAAQPVIHAFMGKNDFSGNTYVEIYGTNFAPAGTSRLWQGGDFNGSNAPTALDGVSVTVNNRPAFMYFLSPTQININTPSDDSTGPVVVEVRTANGTARSTVNKGRISPALLTTPSFTIGGKQYIAALHPASAPGATVFAGRGGLIQGASFQTVKAGDVIVLYALGCGPTNPATQGGVVAAQNSAMTLPFQVRIGGTQAQVNFAGVIQGSIGLYQFNVVIPANFGSGDQSIELIVDGVSDGQSLFLSNQ